MRAAAHPRLVGPTEAQRCNRAMVPGNEGYPQATRELFGLMKVQPERPTSTIQPFVNLFGVLELRLDIHP